MFFSFVLIFSTFLLNTSFAQSLSKREIQISNEFSLHLLQTLSNEDNTFFSAPALTQALLALQTNAKDQTKEDLTRILDLKPNDDSKAISSGIKSLLDELDKKNSKDLMVKLLTTILIQQDQPKDSEDKDSILKEVNFKTNSKQITKQLNQRIQEKSSGSISRIFRDNLDPESGIVLTNAVYFHGKWKVPFQKSSKRDFQNFISYHMPGIPTSIPFMETKAKLKSKSYPEIRSNLIEIPYSKDNLSMVMVIPSQLEDLEFLNENMTLTQLSSALNDLDQVSPKLMKLVMPRFKLDLIYDLKDSLEQSSELNSLFSDQAQLFDQKLKLSPAIHKALIDVDEQHVNEEPEQTQDIKEEVLVDKPFVFLIRDKSSGLIVFMGRVQTLVDEELLGLGFI